ncbi:MAG: NADH-quinone oxidoreductase subunit J [Frankia sp.]|nr:NADH-quinone oxidoreductase subunit J [Frankia sp.]
MDATVLAQTAQITSTSGGEALTFWIVAPVAVLAALGMVLARSAVHGALALVANLFCIAVCYLLQDAPFLGLVQIVVYTGAIMVLFLFVLMLVGVDSSDSLVETLRGQRVAAIILGLGFAGLLAFPIGNAISGQAAVGVAEANQAGGGNMHSIARLLFTDYVFAFEAVSALLVIAAVGAMILGHRERSGPKLTQKETMLRRFAEGKVLTPLPGPGVYARADSADQRPTLPRGVSGLTGDTAPSPAPRDGAGEGDAGDGGEDSPSANADGGTTPVGAGTGGGL